MVIYFTLIIAAGVLIRAFQERGPAANGKNMIISYL